jgi:hypothetical protein
MTIQRLTFRLTETDDPLKYRVALVENGVIAAEADFACSPHTERNTQQALERIDSGQCKYDDLCYVGSQLWDGLISGDVRVRYRAIREAARPERDLFHIRLCLPRGLEALPWESLYDPSSTFLATQERFCIIRDAPDEFEPPRPWEDTGRPLRMLLVMPEGSGLQLERERDLLTRRLAALGDRICVVPLEGKVTPSRLRQTLAAAAWDILHFAGHARTSPDQEVEIRLNSEDAELDDLWMEAETFTAFFNTTTVRLVVMNCCRAASVYRSTRPVSGLGPFLLRKGIPAVVAMRYEVTDTVSLQFADEFYRLLLTGSAAVRGRVDLAVEGGRLAVYQNKTAATLRGFVTPSLYIAPNCEQLFTFGGPPTETVAPGLIGVVAVPPEPGPPTAVAVPGDLVAALRKGSCVPVIGPGLLSAGSTRANPAPLGPRALARLLARTSEYPLHADFELNERAGEWMDTTVLQWVCQHFHSIKRIRHRLYATIDETYTSCQPPETLRVVASWNVPGFICTYFDGLIEQALKEHDRDFTVNRALQEGTATERGKPLLVHLRGSWSDIDTLVLTEEEHDQLWDRLTKIPPQVAALVHGAKLRSLLFLGIHPRDPLAHRLGAKLLDPRISKSVGPVYFVHPSPTPVDEAFWDNYRVEWIKADAGDVVHGLDAALRAEVQA